MKTPLILLTSLTMSITMLTPDALAANPSSKHIAKQVVTALQRNSAHEIKPLFPTLSDFHQLMQENSLLYGDFLPEAKKEFANEYERKIAPAFRNSFEQIISEGTEKGIDWKDIQFVDVQIDDQQKNAPATITFSSKGKQYQLVVEKTLSVNGQWKLSQFMKLI